VGEDFFAHYGKKTRKGVIYHEKNFILMFSKQGDAEPSPVSFAFHGAALVIDIGWY
jgi:hypothetical protein